MCSKPLANIPSGYVKIAIENGHLYPFIVSFPIKNGDFPWLPFYPWLVDK